MIRYLEQDEKQKSRKLWGEAFPEDSESFSDFYYGRKMSDNRILVKEDEGEIVSMAHLNPYRLMVRGRLWSIEYIVGVATAAHKRHCGHMRDVLTCIILDMYKDGRQFCYLMPADERIYLPFDFTYIYDQPLWVLRDDGKYRQELYSEEDQPLLICWMNRWLSENYQVYSLRDQAYIENLLCELESERGKLELLYDGQRLIGMRALWGLEKVDQRALLCERSLIKDNWLEKPAIMARIIHLKEFVYAVCLRENADTSQMQVRIRIIDGLICENQGTFLWYIDKISSRLEQEPDDVSASLELHISQMTGWLFGYRSLEEILPGQEIPKWCVDIQPLQGVFLDEIV